MTTQDLRLASLCMALFCLVRPSLDRAIAAEATAREPSPAASTTLFEIRLVDTETGRGVPLVELETVNRQIFVTDSAGRVALDVPEWMGQDVFFFLRAHGYQPPKDGFGIEGIRVRPSPGGRYEARLRRENIAERLYRVTGQWKYRDSVRLGYTPPVDESAEGGRVAGQDSVFGAVYRGRIHWFWGDTARMAYPLGLFRMAGATSRLPADGGLAPSVGVALRYFTGADGYARAMAEVADPKGVVWVDGICTVADETGKDRLVGHYSRRAGLDGEYEHGMMVYDDAREIFVVKTTLPLAERWRFLSNHPVVVERDGRQWLYCGVPELNVRVPARLADVLAPASYEAWTCLAEHSTSGDKATPARDAAGRLAWRWQRELPPCGHKEENQWLATKVLQPEEARFVPLDGSNPKHRIVLHTGSVRWNPHRKQWLMIVTEAAKADAPSLLGEVWCSEAPEPEGPFRRACRILTHQRQTFYNPCQHDFFDEDGGRFIYFEGTYDHTFSGNPHATPLYNYNQIMYRLDLDHPRLRQTLDAN